MIFEQLRRHIFLSLCICSMILTVIEPFGPKSGPYDVVLEKMVACPDEGTNQIQFDKVFSSAGNGKYLFSTKAYSAVPIDEKFMLKVDLQSWGNGGYRPRFMMNTVKGCSGLLKMAPDMVASVVKSLNQTLTECPLPAGNYTLTNWEVYLRLPGIHSMIYNKYRGVGTMLYDKVKVGCVMVYGEVVPKLSTN